MRKSFGLSIKDQLNYLYLIGLVWLAVSCVAVAVYMQFAWGQTPCVLCLFQRYCFFGIAVAALLQLTNKPNVKYKSFGIMLLLMVLLETIGIRHSLYNICPRVDHPWMNPPFLGIRIPIWSVILGKLLSLSVALNFIFLQTSNQKSIHSYPTLHKLMKFSAVILLIFLALNIIAVFFQCALGTCHTYSYKLLNYF